VADTGHSINYVTGAAYGPDGQITDFISGQSSSFAGIVNSLSYNQRLQPVNIAAVSPNDPSPATSATASVTINGSLTGSDAGTVSLTVGNFTATACFGNSTNPACSGQPVNTTASQVASVLASAINVSASPATATVNGATLSLIWKEAGNVIAGVTALATIHDQPNLFADPSFTSVATSFTGGGDGTSPNILSISYDFHNGNRNNGNVWGITNNKDTTRNQSFTYDTLNRLTSAQNAGTNCTKATLNGGTEYWGNSYTYDAWGNLLSKTPTANRCSGENLTLTATASNQLQGYGYDAAGNMIHDLATGTSYIYDQENRITGAAGFTYTYDAHGNRVEKSNGSTGALYWYMTPGIMAESDLSGNLQSEYIFFSGKRVARKDFSSGNVSYYFSDRLKGASVITDATGSIKSESDYYPWGGELQFANSDPNHYKYGGHERDPETGLDYQGARYYSNPLGRFLTPDWAADPVPVPFANIANPQTFNQYAYVANNPASNTDATGHYLIRDSNCKGKASCQKKYDEEADQFEKERQKALNSKDPRVRAAAAAYGDPGDKNGVNVGFDKLPDGIKGKVDAGNNGVGKLIDIEVTFRQDLSGKSLQETLTHEGSHVADDIHFLTSYDFNTGKYNSDLNPYHLQTEFNAYSAGAGVNQEHGFGPNDGPRIVNFIYAQPQYRNILFQPLFPKDDFPQVQGPPEE